MRIGERLGAKSCPILFDFGGFLAAGYNKAAFMVLAISAASKFIGICDWSFRNLCGERVVVARSMAILQDAF